MDSVAMLGLAFVGLCAMAVAAIMMRATPRGTFVLWCVVLFFVPTWIGVSVGTFWAAITLVTILAIVSCGASIRLSAVDGFVAAFALLVLGQFALRATSLSAAVIAVMEWVIPYIWGRVVLARVSRSFLTACLAAFTVAAAALALVEFASGVNVFLLLPAQGPSFEVWGNLQLRGGFVRAEGAFGHSIALGASLAMGSAFVMAAPWRTSIRILGLMTVAAATVVTFSRIGLITLVLAVALSVFTLPNITRATRIAVAASGLAAALVLVPFVSAVFLEAGGEASGSADYRTGLLDILPLVQLFGSAPDLEGVTIGGQYLGYYAASIDNALLVVALRVGWVPTALLVTALVLAVLPLFQRGGSNPAVIAVATQIPSLLTVAFITQYGMFFWFLVGLAVAWQLVPRHRRPEDLLFARDRLPEGAAT